MIREPLADPAMEPPQGRTYAKMTPSPGRPEQDARPTAESRSSRTHQERVEKLQQLRYLLESAFQDERAMLEWLHSPVPAFRGRSPLSLLKEGQLDELIEAVATLDAGSVV